MIERFLLDQTLGRLAKWLRLLGYDAALVTRLPPRAPTNCRALTRNTALAHLPGFTLIEHDKVDDQLRQVVENLGLAPDPARFFSRCLECNLAVAAVSRDQIQGLAPEYILHTAERFTRCPACGRVYWPGSHGRGALAKLGTWLNLPGRQGSPGDPPF